MQLMVPKEEVVKELEEQGIAVHAIEDQLCTIAQGLVTAARAQVRLALLRRKSMPSS